MRDDATDFLALAVLPPRIDEALRRAGYFALQAIPRESGGQQLAGQRKRDAGCINGEPATAPLLGDKGGGAGAAGGIKHEVTGVGGH